MAGPHVKRLVELSAVPEADGIVGQRRRHGSHQHGGQRGDESRGGGDRGQADHHPRGDPQGAGPAVQP